MLIKDGEKNSSKGITIIHDYQIIGGDKGEQVIRVKSMMILCCAPSQELTVKHLVCKKHLSL